MDKWIKLNSELSDCQHYADDLKEKLAAANARIAELEAQVDDDGIVRTLAELGMQLESANARIAELEAQLAKPATIHEVIDDFGTTVTAVTL